MEALRLIWDDAFLAYDFGPHHPMSPLRLELAERLVRELGLLEQPGVVRAAAEPATDEQLGLVHDPRYVDAVKAASQRGARPAPAYGLGTEDVPVFPGMHAAS